MTENTLSPIKPMVLETSDLHPFGFILQQGFDAIVQTGCSLKSLLCDQFGILPEYLDTRIKTIFFNGKPVDDYESAVITDNAVLALSAAMPGLVGATFRSGGILSPFRSGISFRNPADFDHVEQQGKVTIKLFNLLVKEIGPRFLETGIWVEKGTLKDVLMHNPMMNFEQIGKKLDNNDSEPILICVRQVSA